jgi:hypothetical protein
MPSQGVGEGGSSVFILAMGWTIGVPFPAEAGLFFSLPPPSIQWVTLALSPGVKQLGREADHSPPSRGEVKNEWS